MINKPGMCNGCEKIEWYLVDGLCKECHEKNDDEDKRKRGKSND